MARQRVPTDLPDRIVFPPGAHVKVTNTGSQIVYISDTADALFQVNPQSNTPLQGMPLSPDKTETWWGPPQLWIRAAFKGGEIEATFSMESSEPPATPPAPEIQKGWDRAQVPSVEYTNGLYPILRGRIFPR